MKNHQFQWFSHYLEKEAFHLLIHKVHSSLTILFEFVFHILYCILEKRKYLSLADCITRQHNALPLPPLHIRGQNIGNYFKH